MQILFLKSALETPPAASSTIDPIDVPDRRICLEIVNSFFSFK